MEVKKTFEEPKVEKVEFDFKTRIAASGCSDENVCLEDCDRMD
jgi:hypothetical protein